MTGRLAVNGTNIQTGSTADAAQDFAAIGGEYLRALVVHKDHMHFLRAGGSVSAGRAIDELGVDGELLAGGGAAEKVQKNGEFGIRGNDFFDSHESDVDLRRGEAEAGIAFVGN